MKLLGAQLAGVAATGIFVFAVALIAWVLIKAIMGLRVSLQEEIEGLDIGEHGNRCLSGIPHPKAGIFLRGNW